MRSMCKWLCAALLSCATFVCPAEEDPVGEYLMFWMLDYAGKAADMADQVAQKTADGYIPATRDTANDFNWSKLVAVVNGEKFTVGAADLTEGLSAGSVAEPLVADLGDISGTITSFAVEFYNYNAETKALTLLGWTESVTPETLLSQGAIADFRDPKFPQAAYSAWSPENFSAVPEPTSGMLLLIGGALLALRRRRAASVEC